jgi:NAD+ synthase (glutamine-hydrolysing)
MAMVNHHGGMLLNCSNKTELALGYSTIYGDMAGVLSPIGDLTKMDVYKLAKWIQAKLGIIPEFILERAPTAELKPEQIDPFDYKEVSPAKEQLVMMNQSDHDLRRSEYKRWQMGVILRVTGKAFGTGRMIPITRR